MLGPSQPFLAVSLKIVPGASEVGSPRVRRDRRPSAGASWICAVPEVSRHIGQVTVRPRRRLKTNALVHADDFRKATERNAAVLARADDRGFGT